VQTLEHCTWMTDGGFDRSEEVTAEIAAKGIYVCPAISETWRGYPARFGAEVTELLLGRVRWMAERGVRLIAGTDSGIPGARFGAYVDGLHVFREAGLAAERILELATVEPARALGLASVTGQLAQGLRADVVVVDGDPLADLDALRSVRLVVADGRPHAASVLTLASAPLTGD
jgi:imidazolonepropionase-like amidohydrolase